MTIKENPKITAQFCLKLLYFFPEIIKRFYPGIAWMEMDCNLKKVS